MSNTNEKAQSAEYTSSEINQADAYLEPLTRSDTFPIREAIGKGFIAGQRSMQSRISQLETDLAKSQEKCKALTDGLILLVDWEKGIDRQSVTYRQRMEIAEQALKLTDDESRKWDNPGCA